MNAELRELLAANVSRCKDGDDAGELFYVVRKAELDAALLAAAQDGEDAARLDALEREVREHGGLRLHTGDFENVRLGVGIHHFDSLRDAIDRLFLSDAARSADAEPQE
jgi:hypothetical protein